MLNPYYLNFLHFPEEVDNSKVFPEIVDGFCVLHDFTTLPVKPTVIGHCNVISLAACWEPTKAPVSLGLKVLTEDFFTILVRTIDALFWCVCNGYVLWWWGQR